ncbi:TIGR03435 family protein [Terriglobus sp. TAA 43]|uniref:TIGR03435 family protein n=1 Tax=Terriglobus sp. TAA 43 TaxID=278961 RepID=UPI0012ED4305|nr:TIGR03435 family protein [Terriglobus sp. TAA 43]
MTRHSLQWILVLLSLPATVHGLRAQQVHQDVTSPLKFDAVTVKPNKTGSSTMASMYHSGDMLQLENITLQVALWDVFDQQEYLIDGVPDWGKRLHFDIQGKILDATPQAIDALTLDQRRAMVIRVLQERFGLKTHWITRDAPEYALVVAKGGSKLTPTTFTRTSSGRNLYNWSAESVTTDDLAKGLAGTLRRPVENRTGLTGQYDFHLKWSADKSELSPGSAADDAPSIFTAVKETLGLELKPITGPVQVLVVDTLELPDEN